MERSKSVIQDLIVSASNIQELLDAVKELGGIPPDVDIGLCNIDVNEFAPPTTFEFKNLPDKIKIRASRNNDLNEYKPAPSKLTPPVVEEKSPISSIHEQLPTEAPEELREKLDKLRTLNQKIIETHEENPPDELICPITFELMSEPVIASDGYSYEKAAIQHWLITKGRQSPKTNQPLTSVFLYPNHILAMQIRKWREGGHSQASS